MRFPTGLEIQSVTAWPARVELRHPWDAAQILITGQLDSGQQIDLTRTAQLTSDASIVRRFGAGPVAAAGRWSTDA